MSHSAIPNNMYCASAGIYERVKNGYFIPESLAAMLEAQGILNSGSLSQQDHQVIKLLVSEKSGCDGWMAAHNLDSDLTALPVDAQGAIRAGQPTGDARRDALARFVSHLQTTSDTMKEDEFNAIRAAGYTDAQLAEISLTVALDIFINTFNRIIGDARPAE
ncbi:carboxymuconolactone decarboxylase family protein [Cupriavidus sp. RAF12]|uniref:carboxymuconolactone decarboxylase family protein n=1 Tax=Cupriavidus sp. RAF12 TaxID=3233050 RepID=UPI003F908B11